MKKDRFFGFLGRANAVILFFAGLGLLVFMGFGFSEIWDEERPGRNRHPQWENSSSDGETPAEDPALPRGPFKPANDETWVFAEYEVERPLKLGKKERPISQKANYLFLNTETGLTRWLRPHNDGIVDYLDYGYRIGFDWDEANVPFLLFLAWEKDSSGDGVINQRDRKGLAISARDGSDYRILVEEFGAIHFMKRKSSGNITVLHRLDDELWMVTIDPETRKLVGQEKVEVPRVENQEG